MNKTDKRADIMDVALNLIAERGFHDSPMALIAKQAGVLYSLSLNKFYIDEIYQWFNRNIVTGLARVLYWVDLNVVDGIVDGAAQKSGAVGAILRRFQTGQTQHYAALMLMATVMLTLILAITAGAVAGGGKI